MAFTCVSAFAVALNATMLPVALARIGDDLSLGSSALGWLLTSYFLANGVAVPFFGRLADLQGLDRAFAGGLVAFLFGSLLCALAPDYLALVIGRGLQGVGAAAVVGLGPTALSLSYPPERRGGAIGTLGATVGVAYAAGPVVGGLLAEVIGWRWLFAAGVLFAALFPLAAGALPKGSPSAGGRLDLPGGLFLGVALAGGLFALTEGGQGTGAPALIAAAAGVCAVGLAALVVRQRTAREPFVPRPLLANGPYVLLSLLTLLFVGSNITVNTTLPLPLAEIGGLSASRTGLALLPAALATILAARLSGWAVDTFGPVAPIRAGVAAVVVSLVLLSAFGVDGPLWAASSLAALASVGAVLAKVATTKAVSLSVPRHSLASAISINESVWFVGASLGTVLFSATVTARAEADAAVNPLHSGAGAAYSDAYLALAVPLTALLIVTGRLPRRDRQT